MDCVSTNFEVACNQTANLGLSLVDVVLAKVFDYASTALTFGDVGCVVGKFSPIYNS